MIVSSMKEVNKETCEVCVTMIEKFIEQTDSETKKSVEKVQDAFMKFCKTKKKDDNRLCYYVGGLEESATSVLGEITKRVTWGVPADKICMHLNKKDSQICELKYEKQIDLTKVNLKKLKVKDLKKILSDWDENCKGCTEKSDFISKIKELMPIHAPDAAKILKKKEEL
ncbi:DgyrCDS3431 [Dimorphilus gyrociliatus]|uniref:Mesencephalic astrocyte-derived neurotrophic factor homolog n=1 Tax=Dimorphilus gyrociliatus TaxID=2664684 RepID=A0A7I8VFV6_9ANNE|nr:DgyrCDS3431 [Dimorphilus gyrociliatus]